MLRRPAVLAAAAGACLVAALLVWVAALHVGFVQRADLRVLGGFVGLQGTRLYAPSVALGKLFNPAPFAVLAAAVVGAGLARRRPRLAVAAAAAMLAANVTTQVLKPALADWRPFVPGAHVAEGAWPSGHATAAMSLALALVLVSSPRVRPFAAALGGLAAAAVACAVLVLGWHYPSDVVGGFLVAAFWSCLVAAVALRRVAYVRRPALGPPALAGVALAAAFAALGAAHPDHTTFVAGAAALAAGALALASAVSVALSGSGPAPTAAPRRRRRR
jgi:membrane-associated phospholipid phosphatase